jgi:hypothetical protein
MTPDRARRVCLGLYSHYQITVNVVELQSRKPYAIITRIFYNKVGERDCQAIKGDRGGLAVTDIVNPGGGTGIGKFVWPKLEQDR